MTKKQFRHDFLRGLGSALIELQSSDNPRQYLDIVLYGCTHNTTYDMQCEGDRGWYLYQAAARTDKDTVLQAVIQRYARPIKDDWLFNQLTSILYQYACEGDVVAHDTLYTKYDAMLEKLVRMNTTKDRLYPERDMFDWLCVWLTSLDGWKGFKRITTDIAERLMPRNADFFFSEWFYDNSKGKFGKNKVDAYLRKQAEYSDRARLYLQKTTERDNHIQQETPKPTFADVLASIDGERFRGRGVAMRFVQFASDAEIGRLIDAAMSEADERKKAELLWGLRREKYRERKYPFTEDFIAELLGSDNEDIRDTAFYIMEQTPSPKMREYAMELLEKGGNELNGLSLLAKNLRPKDERWFCDRVKAIPVKLREGGWHSAFMSAEDGIKTLRERPKSDILEYIYRETYCAACRERIVSLMRRKRVLSETILQECRYDSNYDIRSMGERIIRKQANIDV